MVENPLYTIKLSFNVSGDRARKILSTAWLFKLACHRVLGRSKELQSTLIPSKIAWIKMFYSDARSFTHTIRGMLTEQYTSSTVSGRVLGG